MGYVELCFPTWDDAEKFQLVLDELFKAVSDGLTDEEIAEIAKVLYSI